MCKKENWLPVKKQKRIKKEDNMKKIQKRNQKYNEERKTSEKQSITKEKNQRKKRKKNQTKARDCTNGPAQFSEYPLDPLKVQNRAGSVSLVC